MIKKQSEDLIRTVLNKRPDFRRALTLNRRIRHNPDMLFSEGFPKLYPTSIASVDEKLTSLIKYTIRPKPRIIRHLFLAIDVGIVMLTSILVKYRNLILSNSKS